jgi:hypothetical protein
MKFRDNKIATARREVGIVRNKIARKAANRAVRRARRLYIEEDSAN